jgi:hypothetical protein
MKREMTEDAVPGVDRIAERVHEAVDAAHEQAKKVAAGAGELAEGASERIEGATSSVGTMLRRAAKRLRQPSRVETRLFSPRKTVADGLDRAGTYLEQEGAGRLRTDVEEIVRNRPLQALFVSVSAGYLLARSLRR